MSRKSVLFTPGDRSEMMRKAPESGADVLVFDLEDAVAPGRKDEARTAVHDVLTDPSFDPDCEVCVRVNPTTEVLEADLEGVLGPSSSDGLRFDSAMLPKVGAPADVADLADRLATYGLDVPVLALIENARGVLSAPEIAAAPATDALVFGAEDLSADIGATRTDEGIEVLYARERVVIAASAHGCDAIDTIVSEFDDEERLAEEAAFAVQLGYDGKLAIHPAQVDPINRAFEPDEDDLEWARTVVEAAREADAEERGVFEVEGEMIDAPLIARAERILERAEIEIEASDDADEN
ncbi:HpcH/HpaI aldolase/citrate lyase family protein [Natrialbaceae archaeon GCM10025810]|uniref:HpcH/HpaI aldolase/citrate lyase family protein n=1 Tax=Halovalidus salilacus TaxID=3075124 RepID=UPI00361488C7